MADLKDTQIKEEIDSIMDRVAQIMEKIGSLGLDQDNAEPQKEAADKPCCANG